MGKRDELKELDDLLRARYIKELTSGDVDIKDLAQISSYLGKNNETSDKEVKKEDTPHDEIKNLLE